MRYKPGDHYKVSWSVSHDLVGDADFTALSELGFGYAHEKDLFFELAASASKILSPMTNNSDRTSAIEVQLDVQVIDLHLPRTTAVGRSPSDAAQHDRSRLRPADWPVRESRSNGHQESEQSSSRRLRHQFGRGVRDVR